MTSAPSASSNSAAKLFVRPDNARDFISRVLVANGLPKADAATVANCLVRADLRGVDTHGMQYLPHYIKRVRSGLINPKPALSLEQITPVVGLIDGQNAFGFVVATRAMAEAVNLAKTFGIGLVCAKHSTHFGMAACYVLQAVEAGFLSLVFTNASRAMAPWGGRESLLGTSPFAAGAPSGNETPYVLDMSPAVAARGKIRRAAKLGQQIPVGYALDALGRSTTDPKVALAGGVVLPIGGAKGSAISMLMDILSGVLTGAAYAGGVANQFEDFDRAQDVGHFFFAIRPDLFVAGEEFRERMDTLVKRVHAVPPADGFSEILMPGELESRLEQERMRSGIPYNSIDVSALQSEAAASGQPPLPVSAQPFGA